ncbi:hypothetical protein DV515_00008899 [Chloebia gouldiae]|uniref:Uncharacterized protein n=1 Tax=Chloebia gouldiae TaxID=44316 RepID=A0A3L8SDZ8_CHLGU|nr:hypothetical protein DV515_00008899 [Chloebia gouldiae]
MGSKRAVERELLLKETLKRNSPVQANGASLPVPLQREMISCTLMAPGHSLQWWEWLWHHGRKLLGTSRAGTEEPSRCVSKAQPPGGFWCQSSLTLDFGASLVAEPRLQVGFGANPVAQPSLQNGLSSICDEPINWIKSSGTDFLAFETHNLGWVSRTAQSPCKQQITGRSAQHFVVCVRLLEPIVSVEQHPELQDFGKSRAVLPLLMSEGSPVSPQGFLQRPGMRSRGVSVPRSPLQWQSMTVDDKTRKRIVLGAKAGTVLLWMLCSWHGWWGIPVESSIPQLVVALVTLVASLCQPSLALPLQSLETRYF